MQVHILTSTVSDNYFYLIESAGDGLLIDPIDAPVAVEAVRGLGLDRVRILATHGHPDHIGGNAAVVDALGCEVLAPSHGSTFTIEHDHAVSDGDTVTVGDTDWRVHHLPGHTDDHVVLHHGEHLISGDVVFVAGAGHCRFGGDPCELYTTFHQRMADLPDALTFYPGHDYAARNASWILSVDPGNAAAAALQGAASKRSRADGPWLHTLGAERAMNPFFRVGDRDLRQTLAATGILDLVTPSDDPAETAFRALRAHRDRF